MVISRMRFAFCALIGLCLAAPAPARAQEPAAEQSPPSAASQSICLMVEAAATANALPVEFFARVIWQESRFQPDAVGPTTRSGNHAQGIAQFMPGTAAERGLLDPFDPVQALPKSAEFLRELADTFGNLGLAAAAYNAGPRRVRDWLAGRGGLPAQTRAYVRAITGRSAEDWAAGADAPQHASTQPRATPSCRELTALIKQTPSVFVAELERRVTASAAAPWGVVLGAGFSRAKVLTAYASQERRFRALLAERDLSIVQTVLRSRGSRAFYQVRVGADSRQNADRLCAGLRTAGGACMVLRNPGIGDRGSVTSNQ
jgi:hypothetical protein